jgi:phage/plasmid-associated DNA primase
MVHVLKEGNGLRKLLAPAKVLEYTSDYRNDNDGIAKFIADKISPLADDEHIVPVDKTTLKRVFKIWMSDNDIRLSPSELEKRMDALYGKYPRGGWTKIKLDN